ncbi:MAG: protease pro-enzyme activation domain-containing protein [Candidatus Thermoplasmatota archaeon]|nr:protease pro-enzyme activation domain-containing protein [Candidatus Thermoplasmatota archaeon]
MRRRSRREGIRPWAALAAGLIGVLLVGSGASLVAGAAPTSVGVSGGATSLSLSSLLVAPRLEVSQLAGGPSDLRPIAPYNGIISVFVAFAFSNQSQLAHLLQHLSNTPAGPDRTYLTAAQFDRAFAANARAYAAARTYFGSLRGVNVTTYADRSGVFLSGPAPTIARAFGVRIAEYYQPSRGSYYAAIGAPTLPAPIASSVIQVTGLSDYVAYHSDIASTANLGAAEAPVRFDGYPVPNETAGAQQLYGSDLQVAYDEQALLNISDASDEVVATILWAGCSVNTTTSCPTNDLTAPFDPSDVYAYFNDTIPAGESHATVYGVPLDGAPPPGSSAASDQSGAVVENSLDLEMVGSTAPGAQIYNVYGTNSGVSETNNAMTYILNPPAGSPLENVQVVSNSWGGPDEVNSAWSQDMEEAAARGITVLAATGDSGDNTESSSYLGTMVEFPSTVAYNTYGVMAVGGTTLQLDLQHGANYLHILNQTAWYDANANGDTNVLGSTGGTSSLYSEPSWQADSEANSYIVFYASQHEAMSGQRGVPDVAAIANDTYVFYPGPGGAPALGVVAGTSVAAPVTAGLIAEIDAILSRYGQPPLGFADPAIYQWANEYDQTPPPLANGGATGTDSVGSWTSMLPNSPVSFITSGRNSLFPAQAGYSLVTGWGSLDAYNFTACILDENYSGSGFALNGVGARLSLSGLSVYSHGGSYNASVQLNAVIANSLGAPLYWVQNVIYLNKTSGGAWAANYTGWISYPYFGLYPRETIYTYDFPVEGTTIVAPVVWSMAISLSGSGTGRTLNFDVNGTVLQLAVPGASFIIAGYNYSYFWQGQEFTNGPFANSAYAGDSGGLDPQLALVGGPTLGQGIFGPSTAGQLTLTVQETGQAAFVDAPGAAAIRGSVSQTGETAANLTWVGSGSNWNVSYEAGASDQGVVLYNVLDAGNPALVGSARYSVNFTESGLPAGSAWSLVLEGPGTPPAVTCVVGSVEAGCNGTTISLELANGTFYFETWSLSNYLPRTGSGAVSVHGTALKESVDFAAPPTGEYVVTFEESGLPHGTIWSVTSIGSAGPDNGSSQGPVVQFSLAQGAYRYTVAPTAGYAATPSSGSFRVVNSTQLVSISFAPMGSSGSTFADLSSLCVAGTCGFPLIYLLVGIAIVAGGIAAVGSRLSRRAERRERTARAARAMAATSARPSGDAVASATWSPPGLPRPAEPPSPGPDAEPPAPGSPPPANPPISIVCPTCGSSISTMARYCPICGTAAPPSTPPHR